ncbi:MAG: hypothetical protein N2053_10995, partial [Chitinispirillaceae bacterium]|nr:hypothetical protein [Chitinispirillaceae bacterium]
MSLSSNTFVHPRRSYSFIKNPDLIFIFLFLYSNIIFAADYKWDVSTSSDYQAGSGTWGINNYWTLDGVNLVAWPGAGNSAYFGGSDGTWTITVSGTQSVDSITFYNNGYTLNSGTLSFGSPAARFYTATNVYATVNSVITGSGGLQKYGIGNLTLGAANTYTGTTYIRYGTIDAGNNSAFNNTSIVFDGTGGRICLNNGITISNSLTISVANPGTGVGVIHGPSTAGQTATYSGSISVNANTSSGGHFHGGNTTGGLTISGTITAPSNVNVFQRGGRVTFS